MDAVSVLASGFVCLCLCIYFALELNVYEVSITALNTDTAEVIMWLLNVMICVTIKHCGYLCDSALGIKRIWIEVSVN